MLVILNEMSRIQEHVKKVSKNFESNYKHMNSHCNEFEVSLSIHTFK